MRKSINGIIIRPSTEERRNATLPCSLCMCMSAEVAAHHNLTYVIPSINASSSFMQLMLDFFFMENQDSFSDMFIYNAPVRDFPGFALIPSDRTHPSLLKSISSKGNILLISSSNYCQTNFLYRGVCFYRAQNA